MASDVSASVADFEATILLNPNRSSVMNLKDSSEAQKWGVPYVAMKGPSNRIALPDGID